MMVKISGEKLYSENSWAFSDVNKLVQSFDNKIFPSSLDSFTWVYPDIYNISDDNNSEIIQQTRKFIDIDSKEKYICFGTATRKEDLLYHYYKKSSSNNPLDSCLSSIIEYLKNVKTKNLPTLVFRIPSYISDDYTSFGYIIDIIQKILESDISVLLSIESKSSSNIENNLYRPSPYFQLDSKNMEVLASGGTCIIKNVLEFEMKDHEYLYLEENLFRIESILNKFVERKKVLFDRCKKINLEPCVNFTLGIKINNMVRCLVDRSGSEVSYGSKEYHQILSAISASRIVIEKLKRKIKCPIDLTQNIHDLGIRYPDYMYRTIDHIIKEYKQAEPLQVLFSQRKPYLIELSSLGRIGLQRMIKSMIENTNEAFVQIQK